MDFKNRPIVVWVDKDNKYIDSLIPKSLVDVGVNIKKIDMGNPEEGTHRNCSCDHDKDYEKCYDPDYYDHTEYKECCDGICQDENKKNEEKIDCYYDLDTKPSEEELEILGDMVENILKESKDPEFWVYEVEDGHIHVTKKPDIHLLPEDVVAEHNALVYNLIGLKNSKTLGFNEYQSEAHSMAVYPSTHICIPPKNNKSSHTIPTDWVYPALGLANEAGEVLGKLKKIMRDKDGIIVDEDREKIGSEIGDVLWYLSELSLTLGLDLQSVAQKNIDKLRKRKAENKIKGDGDNR
ncbi:nucleoside triphosphate pyrophosphohydrolase family protein [bacterium]|jgi:NTP pyrophosphatase (non-canonical NTP hydrolase)|nr:nucleoside triphosphate pyrophosphohydrolase family protein [bacterium]